MAFSYLLDTYRINASSVIALNKQQDPRKIDFFAFGMNLVIELVLPFVEHRYRNGLTVDIVQKLKLVFCEFSVTPSLSNGLLTPFAPISEGQRRCELLSRK